MVRKMTEAAAERIRKTRGENDGFSKRATLAAKQNKETANASGSGNDHANSSGAGQSGFGSGSGSDKVKKKK